MPLRVAVALDLYYTEAMKIIITVIVILVLVKVVILAIGYYRTAKSESSPNQALFHSGHIPDPQPDGFYRGAVTGYNGSWQGKKFNKTAAVGINIFKQDSKGDATVEQYPFKTYPAKGLRDKTLDVYRIDYAVAGNPLWLRFVRDEIVELEPGHYLGKIQIQLLPRLIFTLGYFRLEK